MTVVWSEQALSDVEDIRSFIARDAPHFADLFVDRVLGAVERLADFPLSGRVVPEFQRTDVREVLLGSYRIVYHVRGQEVAISTVFHTSRLLGPDHLGDVG